MEPHSIFNLGIASFFCYEVSMLHTQLFDTVIIGGGPAGLSAAIYLARFNRSVVVIEKGGGRWNTNAMNENYLGFPNGIPSRELQALGEEQAKRFGAQFVKDDVSDLVSAKGIFTASGNEQEYHGKTLVLATGVVDLQPIFPNFKEYLGTSIFWCLTCDGHTMINQKVVVVGHMDDAACSCLQMLNFTQDLTFVTNVEVGRSQLTPKWQERLARANIPVIEGIISDVKGKAGRLKALCLENGRVVETQYLLNQLGATPNSNLATRLGASVNQYGYILTNDEQRTDIPFVYAAGDVTKAFAHQVVSAAHEGSIAAQSANYDLYSPDQKWE